MNEIRRRRRLLEMRIGVMLGGGLLLAALAIGPLTALMRMPAPTPTAADTSSPGPTAAPGPPTVTPTFTPIALDTIGSNLPIDLEIASSPTPDPVARAILAGEVVVSGPLPPEQQVALYRASMAYVQSSVEDSKRIGEQINGVGYGDPSVICGPLAVATLRDAGVVPAYIKPYDYWLLDPTKPPDKIQLQNAFPSTEFTHLRYTTPLNKMDWSAEALMPGDFVFIWHGSGGNFDHMLVVNRVDAGGRPFAVTNFGTEQGFLIAETMLYDPNDPEAGIFHTWTAEKNAILGSTGFGGFEVWRHISE